ncbi:TIGR04104 family putative zinc finger protein [Ornithinibacillus scapharcae]|uniref:TIGR04104 family putative zinc finger protein n=1 Tax=Ornithinibacillus scapharcae TaxID=1147159 RepID=UPI000225B0E2
MQKCEKCHTRFKWIEIYKTVWKSLRYSNTVKCRKCDTEHSLNLESKIINSVLLFITAFISGYIVLNHLDTSDILSLSLFLIIYFLLSTVVFMISPFFFQFYSKYHSNYKVLK